MKLILILLLTLTTGCTTNQINKFVCVGAGTCDSSLDSDTIATQQQERFNNHQASIIEANKAATKRAAQYDELIERERRVVAEYKTKLLSCKNMNKHSKPVTPSIRIYIEEQQKRNLKDPYTAHFKDIHETSDRDQCMGEAKYRGYVNAKNSYGGYVGYTLFEVN